ncbi:membrane protein insertion efficiency factor YidD [Halocola ammonii]
MSQWVKSIFIWPIRFYQAAISPLLGSNCRHQPTCSNYSIEAIKEWGVLKGTWMGMKRISKCHPWGTQGYDPVPKNPEKRPEQDTGKRSELGQTEKRK